MREIIALTIISAMLFTACNNGKKETERRKDSLYKDSIRKDSIAIVESKQIAKDSLELKAKKFKEDSIKNADSIAKIEKYLQKKVKK